MYEADKQSLDGTDLAALMVIAGLLLLCGSVWSLWGLGAAVGVLGIGAFLIGLARLVSN